MKQIIISSLYLLILFSLSHFVFDPAYLYYEIWWLDIPMHIMGGFGVAALANAVLAYMGKPVKYWQLLLAYFVVATVWEVYEYVNSIGSLLGWSGWTDTVKDLFDGFVGASIAYTLVKK
jgi:hypothetical protein